MASYWWYITVLERGDISSQECEEILYSAAEISGSIGTEIQELPDGARMRIYYRSDEELSVWRNRLLDAIEQWPGIKIEDMGKIENQPWSRQSEDAFPPLEVGERLVVLAPWHEGKEPKDRIPLYINPGSAFGTGYHESTQVVLNLLERHLTGAGASGGEKLCSAEVLDVGAGSGILAIAALKLGASRVVSRDIDPVAVAEARNNFERNGVDLSSVTFETGDLLREVDGRFDILLANILFEPLIQMLPYVRGVLKPGAVAIFSGMIEREREDFLPALSGVGLTVLEEMRMEDWWGVAAQNPA
jgi:ribosomal protein L11 methyltransferase